MKKYILLALLAAVAITDNVTAQSKGVRIAYIDMEYILEKVPDYAEAKNQLEQKAEKWKQEIETKKNDIAKLKEALKTEKVLLTKELIAEREEEIAFQENELIEYTQKKFGPNGELIVQKAVLVKPIQDQVFNAVQDIADGKYDFVFDKSSDLTMLFAAKKFDISERVIRVLTRSEKRKEMTEKQLKLEEERERKQDMIDDNPALSERQKQIEERKAARLKMIEDKKLLAEEKKAEADAKRKQLLEEKNNKKNGTVSDKPTTENKDGETKTDAVADKKAEVEAQKKKTLEERQKLIDDRKKAAEEKRQKILAEREAAKKAKEDAKNNKP